MSRRGSNTLLKPLNKYFRNLSQVVLVDAHISSVSRLVDSMLLFLESSSLKHVIYFVCLFWARFPLMRDPITYVCLLLKGSKTIEF